MRENSINILITPTNACNMSCVYCLHKSYHKDCNKMDFFTLKRIYDIAAKAYKNVNIIWHGGEPLLMGLDFYKKAIEMQKSYKDCLFFNRIQSNLTLVTDEFADFFKVHNIGLGTSIDGILNEKLRGNTDLVLLNREKLSKRGIHVGAIVVLSSINIDTLIQSYEFFKEKKIDISMNPYVKSASDKDGFLCLEPIHATEKIIELYEYWKSDKSIHIDYFERIISYIKYQKKSMCKNTNCLGKWIGIGPTGDISPCNRFFPSKYMYGNVWEFDFLDEAFLSKGYKKLLRESLVRYEKCKQCGIFSYCSGGCNNVAYNGNGIKRANSSICYIEKSVYNHIMRDISEKDVI